MSSFEHTLPPLIILDRDGVLNEMYVDANHGLVDSPLHTSHVKVIEGVAQVLKEMTDAGILLYVATNQPAAKKGKTTFENLNAVHALVLEQAQSLGGKILGSEICFDRTEDKSEFRKPEPGMLLKILAENPGITPADVWMVGDGVTDVEAGVRAGVKTAFLGPKKDDARKIFDDKLGRNPDFWGKDLKAFWQHLVSTTVGR